MCLPLLMYIYILQIKLQVLTHSVSIRHESYFPKSFLFVGHNVSTQTEDLKQIFSTGSTCDNFSSTNLNPVENSQFFQETEYDEGTEEENSKTEVHSESDPRSWKSFKFDPKLQFEEQIFKGMSSLSNFAIHMKAIKKRLGRLSKI